VHIKVNEQIKNLINKIFNSSALLVVESFGKLSASYIDEKKIALLVKNSFINFVLKTKIHKLTLFRHMNFYVLFTALITNYFSMQGIFYYKTIKFYFLKFLFFYWCSKSFPLLISTEQDKFQHLFPLLYKKVLKNLGLF